MVHTTVDGTFRQTNLTNESPEYLAKREELRLAEIELMRQRERVAVPASVDKQHFFIRPTHVHGRSRQ